MLYHYHKIFLVNHLFSNLDIKHLIKNKIYEMITFISYDEYKYILKHETLQLPNIMYELKDYDPIIDLQEAYDDIRYGKRAGVIDFITNTIHISFTNCYIQGYLHKTARRNNGSRNIKFLKRNDLIIL